MVATGLNEFIAVIPKKSHISVAEFKRIDLICSPTKRKKKWITVRGDGYVNLLDCDNYLKGYIYQNSMFYTLNIYNITPSVKLGD